MNFDDLTATVQRHSRLNQQESKRVVRVLLKSIHDALVDGDTVKLRLVGTLRRRPKIRRNLQGLHSHPVSVPGQETVCFKPSERLVTRLKPTTIPSSSE